MAIIFQKYCICLKIFITFTNSVDPDEMQYYAAFHLGLHCKSTRLGVSRIQRFNNIKLPVLLFKDIYFVIYGIISDFSDKGQLQYLTNLKGPQEGTYLYTTQFLSLR